LCYPNPDQILVGLSNSTLKYIATLLYGLPRNNQ
jgi:hypothetical protein